MTIQLPPPTAGTTRLILLRHGEPDHSVRGRCYGRLDPGLSAVGREQMRRTWLCLNGVPVTAVYSSPSRRAIESASLRGASTPALQIDAGLREIDFGKFEGLTFHEISMQYPGKYAEWMTRPTDVTFPAGESFARMAARVLGTLDQIRLTHSGGIVAIVAHGGVNRIALAAALGLDSHRIFRLAQAYACVNAIDYVGDEPVVHAMNATFQPC